tara:strand:+ start:315 stop:551 length:237 start_codon:yes stop_codon:yes gene_type:complete
MARFKSVDGVRIQFTAEEEAQRDLEEANALTEKETNGYKIKRAEEYPSWQDQLDDIFHNGIDSWKANKQIIKDKYPKG